MKYTLTQNAISSLSIAIENFKKFYYYEDKYRQSEIDEAIKICIVFLENSIELMLKAILVSTDPLVIYKNPQSRIIQEALTKVDDERKLEDILIAEDSFQTIGYIETVKIYNENYQNNSKKVSSVLEELARKRNSITHFGINEGSSDELIICILNTFDIIYNYLYSQLIEIKDMDTYLVSDDWVVDTVHGKKWLFNEEFVYNNIVDFLDELMETSKEYVCAVRAQNPKSRIYEFTEIMEIVFADKKFTDILNKHHANIEFLVCDYDINEFSFSVIKEGEEPYMIFSQYSPFFNATIFSNEVGKIEFIIVHDEHSIYIYNEKYVSWPGWDDKEIDYQWLDDCSNGLCKKYNLSKRNILNAINNTLENN